MEKTKLEDDSSIPFYYQIKKILIEELESGKWKVGEKIQFEGELCERFNVSRTVVRQSLLELKNEGYIITKRGKGSYVARPKIKNTLFQRLAGFTELMTLKGYKVENKVLRQEKIKADIIISKKLGVEKGEPVIFIKRLRIINDEPVALDNEYFPFKMFPDLLKKDLEKESIYSIIQDRYSVDIASGNRTIELAFAEKEVSELLRVPLNSPLFQIENITYDTNNRIIEYFITLHNGTKTRFIINLCNNINSYSSQGTLLPTLSGIEIKKQSF